MCQIRLINSGTYLAGSQHIEIPKMQSHYVLLELTEELTVIYGEKTISIPIGVKVIFHLTKRLSLRNAGAENSLASYKSILFKAHYLMPAITFCFNHECYEDVFKVKQLVQVQTILMKIIKSHSQLNHITDNEKINLYEKINIKPILVNRILRKHYREQLSLGILAEMIGCTPTYLSNSYSKIFNISPIKHLQEIRLKKAEGLLKNTNMMIYQIAMEIGYISVSQFITYFKKQYSMSPNEYRSINIISSKTMLGNEGQQLKRV